MANPAPAASPPSPPTPPVPPSAGPPRPPWLGKGRAAEDSVAAEPALAVAALSACTALARDGRVVREQRHGLTGGVRRRCGEGGPTTDHVEQAAPLALAAEAAVTSGGAEAA